MQEYSPTQHGKWLNAAALHHPLEFALSQKRFDLADYLTSAGADVNAKTARGDCLIDHFRKLNHTSAVDFLTNHGA
jgi:hypothetical protein